MPFRSEKQRRYLWKNNPEIARKWTNEHGSTPVKAKKGKYQKLEHPDHEIKPIEHKEENVSSKERVEKLLDERKTKKETKKKLVKQGPAYVPGWRPNLSVKAKESKYIQKKSAAKQGLEYANWILKDEDSPYGSKIKKRPRSNLIGKQGYSKWDKSLKNIREVYKRAKETARDRLTLWDIRNAQKTIQGEKKQLESVVDVRSKGGPIKAKKGIGLPPATKYKKYLKGLKKATTTPLSGTSTGLPPKTARLLSQLKFAYKDRNKKFNWKAANETLPFAKSVKKITRKLALNRMKKNIAKSPFLQRRFSLGAAKTLGLAGPSSFPKGSKFLQRRMTLGSAKTLLGKTKIGKAVAAATVVAGAYEAGKRKIFSRKNMEKNAKDWLNVKDKKKVTKKSIGGETVVMKSGGGYINDLL